MSVLCVAFQMLAAVGYVATIPTLLSRPALASAVLPEDKSRTPLAAPIPESHLTVSQATI